MSYNIDLLLDVVSYLKKEADFCYRSERYFASLMLYGAVLEGLLLAMCFVYPAKVRNTEVYWKKKERLRRRGIRKNIFLEFNVSDLLKIAEELRWLPIYWKIDDLGSFKNFVKFVHECRNLIHTARWLKPDPYFKTLHKEVRGFSKRKYKKFADLSREIVVGIISILGGVVNRCLLKDLKKHGICQSCRRYSKCHE